TNYDRTRQLVVDPVLRYATYLGGNAEDSATRVTTDSDGNFYVAGQTKSPDFPVTPSAFQGQPAGYSALFVAKFSPDLQIVYCTYLGGFGTNDVVAIVANAGQVTLAGYSSGSGFPTTPGAFAEQQAGDYALTSYVTKLSEQGDRLIFGTLFYSVSAM